MKTATYKKAHEIMSKIDLLKNEREKLNGIRTIKIANKDGSDIMSIDAEQKGDDHPYTPQQKAAITFRNLLWTSYQEQINELEAEFKFLDTIELSKLMKSEVDEVVMKAISKGFLTKVK